MSIRSVASQLGENTASASAKVTGNGSITLNSRYLLEALSVMPDDEITFSFNGKLEPTLLQSSANPDYNRTSACDACLPGSVQPDKGQGVCLACEPGQAQSDLDQRPARPVPHGVAGAGRDHM